MPVAYQVSFSNDLYLKYKDKRPLKKCYHLKFNPDLVLVSAGFDAAAGDPLVYFKLKNL